MHRYLIGLAGEKKANSVVETLLQRAWRAKLIDYPAMMIETTAPPRMFEKAWNETR